MVRAPPFICTPAPAPFVSLKLDLASNKCVSIILLVVSSLSLLSASNDDDDDDDDDASAV